MHSGFGCWNKSPQTCRQKCVILVLNIRSLNSEHQHGWSLVQLSSDCRSLTSLLSSHISREIDKSPWASWNGSGLTYTGAVFTVSYCLITSRAPTVDTISLESIVSTWSWGRHKNLVLPMGGAGRVFLQFVWRGVAMVCRFPALRAFPSPVFWLETAGFPSKVGYLLIHSFIHLFFLNLFAFFGWLTFSAQSLGYDSEGKPQELSSGFFPGLCGS